MKYLRKRFLFIIFIFALLLLLLSSCVVSNPPWNSETSNITNHESESSGSFKDPEAPEENASLTQEPDFGIKDMLVGLYNGVGSWDLNVIALQNFFEQNGISYELFDENDVASNSLAGHYDLIWFPGGFAAEYKYYIPNLDIVIQFVSDGGYFVGSCAGAYFAADIMRWLGEDQDYPLKLFPGRAAGPLINEIGWGEETFLFLNQEFTANDGFMPELPVYYFDGPYFVAHEGTDVTTVASYRTNSLPAVVAGRYGDGNYLLFGPHPELGGIDPETSEYDIEGGNNAQWPWLFEVLDWFSVW